MQSLRKKWENLQTIKLIVKKKQSKTFYMISKLLSLLFVVCSCSDDPEPDPTSIKSSFWSLSGSCCWLALANCQAGIDGGTTGLFEDTAGNCFLKQKFSYAVGWNFCVRQLPAQQKPFNTGNFRFQLEKLPYTAAILT